jgi:hypothetical protein
MKRKQWLLVVVLVVAACYLLFRHKIKRYVAVKSCVAAVMATPGNSKLWAYEVCECTVDKELQSVDQQQAAKECLDEVKKTEGR